MLTKIDSTIKNFDMFDEGVTIKFDVKHHKEKSSYGGWVSLILKAVLIWQSYSHLSDMWTYNNDIIYKYETPTDFDALGKVDMARLKGSLPFYAFYVHNKGMIPRNNREFCEGNCTEYLYKHVRVEFEMI